MTVPSDRVSPGAVVVGAGPYGLAAAAHLRGRGVDVRVFGEPMDGWRSAMPRGMYLKSTPRASNISDPSGAWTLADFRISRGQPPVGDRYAIPVDEFVAYGEWFQRNRVPDVERTEVVSVTSGPRGFRLELGTGEELTTGAVVVAAGLRPYARVPSVLAAAVDAGLASHTSHHADLGVFAGRRVAVVGAGQSALESAALLHEAGASPTVVARRPQLAFGTPPVTDLVDDRPLTSRLAEPGSVLGPGWPLRAYAGIPWAFRHLSDGARELRVRTVLGPAGAWWLRERVDGRFRVLTGHTVEDAEVRPDGVRLRLHGPDRDELVVDHVLAATGYRVDVDRLDLLDAGLRRAVRRAPGGAPRLTPGFESSVPGLYFTGLTAADTFGPVMRFVCGTAFAGRRVGAAVAAAG
ncbi:FAD-dependent oxidoreductase [Kitasatospora sp. NBC_01539]|uniref:FAD-dependent oxidoreductase n=1 Tax=Kitasatospora sp. NBC_01539 TaxID=2903577 RepID=UPI0038601822